MFQISDKISWHYPAWQLILSHVQGISSTIITCYYVKYWSRKGFKLFEKPLCSNLVVKVMQCLSENGCSDSWTSESSRVNTVKIFIIYKRYYFSSSISVVSLMNIYGWKMAIILICINWQLHSLTLISNSEQYYKNR